MITLNNASSIRTGRDDYIDAGWSSETAEKNLCSFRQRSSSDITEKPLTFWINVFLPKRWYRYNMFNRWTSTAPYIPRWKMKWRTMRYSDICRPSQLTCWVDAPKMSSGLSTANSSETRERCQSGRRASSCYAMSALALHSNRSWPDSVKRKRKEAVYTFLEGTSGVHCTEKRDRRYRKSWNPFPMRANPLLYKNEGRIQLAAVAGTIMKKKVPATAYQDILRV